MRKSNEQILFVAEHKLEWCVLSLHELRDYQSLNIEATKSYLTYSCELLFNKPSSMNSDEISLGRQKYFFKKSVMGFLIISISELYRVDKFKGSIDSVLYTKMINLFKTELEENTTNKKIINESYKRFKETVSENDELIKRLGIARNKTYSHHTNYKPKAVLTNYVRGPAGISGIIRGETEIELDEIIKLLNPYIEFINEFIPLSKELVNDYKKINLIK